MKNIAVFFAFTLLLAACTPKVDTPPPSVAESPAPTVAQTEEVSTDTSPEPSVLPSGEKPDWGSGFSGGMAFKLKNTQPSDIRCQTAFMELRSPPKTIEGVYHLLSDLTEQSTPGTIVIFCNGVPIPFIVDGKEMISYEVTVPSGETAEDGSVQRGEIKVPIQFTPTFTARFGDNSLGKIDIVMFGATDGYMADRMVLDPWSYIVKDPEVNVDESKMLWIESKTSRKRLLDDPSGGLFSNLWSGDGAYLEDELAGFSFGFPLRRDELYRINLHGGKTIIFEGSLRSIANLNPDATPEEITNAEIVQTSRYRTVFFWDDKPIKLPGGKEYIEWQAGADKSATYEFDVSDYLDDKPHSVYAVTTQVDFDPEHDLGHYAFSSCMSRYKVIPRG